MNYLYNDHKHLKDILTDTTLDINKNCILPLFAKYIPGNHNNKDLQL